MSTEPVAPATPIELACRECGARSPAEPRSICEECFGPLEVSYDEEFLRRHVSRESIASGPGTLWRYRPLLPVSPEDPTVDLGAGWTPLRRATRLGEALGISELWIKDDTRNPTAAFKDRVVAVALTKAQAFGFKTIACASTGNLANATAAAAAWAGLDCYVFVPSNLERAKIVATAAFGAKVVAVDGTYDDVNRLCTEVADALPWAFVNVNVRPYYAEGSKTLAFETAEQLGWLLPGHVVVPVASGALLTKIHKGFRQLARLGLVEDRPVRISGAQAAGCAPVSTAFREGADEIAPVRPTGIAKSLHIGNPADGHHALGIVRETGGAVDDVSDEEVIAGIRLLAETEGIFAETAGGVTIGVLRKLRESGAIREEESVVAYVTGGGFKTTEALTGAVGPWATVPPSFEAFEDRLEGRS
ncbi:MAG TPA: threonine synthase [Actinomycetota bacterium]